MREVQRGSRDAFSTLVLRHLDALYAYALRLSQHPATAEDMVQETWLTLWQKARSFNPRKARLSTWLHRVLHNRYVDTLRRERADITAPLDDYPDPAGERSMTPASDQLDELDGMINTLPLTQKSALTLTYLQGFSNRETAEIMGLSTRAVESLLARARATLLARREADTAGETIETDHE